MNKICALIKACIVLKIVSNSQGASDKNKNDVTFGHPADPKFPENVCYSIWLKVKVHQSKTFFSLEAILK